MTHNSTIVALIQVFAIHNLSWNLLNLTHQQESYRPLPQQALQECMFF